MGTHSKFSLYAAALFLLACKREPRCEQCGMKIVAGDAFESTVAAAGTTQHFDTPRCAFEHAKDKHAVRVQEYYDRTWLTADEVKFVKNSDVMGPMGKDFIPVNPKHVDKFLREHGGTIVTVDEIGAAAPTP